MWGVPDYAEYVASFCGTGFGWGSRNTEFAAKAIRQDSEGALSEAYDGGNGSRLCVDVNRLRCNSK